MGCFLSKKRPTKADNKKCGGASPPAPPAPPPPPEEEAVKEVVLSETPILRKPILIEDAAVWEPPANHELKVDTPPAEITQKESTAEFKPCGEDFISQVSEQSDLCSYTESFSTTTTATVTAPEKRDDGEEVTQRSPLRPRRKRPNNGDMVVGATRERNVRSPARRPVPSPEKRKTVQQGRGMPAGPRRNLGPRREGGEVPVQRRSRSPVTRGNVMYKSTAGRNETGRTAGRSPVRAVENSHRAARAVENSGGKSEEAESDGVPTESSCKAVEKQKDNEEERESLDNPLVSLECFIFL